MKPPARPIFFISIAAGTVAPVIAMNWKVMGTVAQPGFGAIVAPIIDETEKIRIICVWPKAWHRDKRATLRELRWIIMRGTFLHEPAKHKSVL